MSVRELPTTLGAIKFTGENYEEIEAFIRDTDAHYSMGKNRAQKVISWRTHRLEGEAWMGDWLIRYGRRFIVACGPEAFDRLYGSKREQ